MRCGTLIVGVDKKAIITMKRRDMYEDLLIIPQQDSSSDIIVMPYEF